MPQKNKSQLALGPGLIRVASLGSLEPTDLTTPWDAAWLEMGYTKEGTKISHEFDTGSVEVAEELYPIHNAINSANVKLSLALMQLTATNLRTALNGGTITVGTGIVTFEPADIGEDLRVMLGYQSQDGTERWVFRECLQSGNVEMERKKGADAATVPMEFLLSKPSATVKPFKAIFSSPARA